MRKAFRCGYHGWTGAETIPARAQHGQVRFSRFVTSTKYFAGSTSNCSLSSYPITVAAWPHWPHATVLRDS
jgi:hypothetical protein